MLCCLWARRSMRCTSLQDRCVAVPIPYSHLFLTARLCSVSSFPLINPLCAAGRCTWSHEGKGIPGSDEEVEFQVRWSGLTGRCPVRFCELCVCVCLSVASLAHSREPLSSLLFFSAGVAAPLTETRVITERWALLASARYAA